MSSIQPSAVPSSSQLQMRCADADREMVATVLNAAYAEGRITLDEHSERQEKVWHARTFADLASLTADLMPADGQRLPRQVGTARPQLAVDTSHQDPSADSLFTVLGTVRRQGMWRMRRRTTGLVLLGDARLDLRQAVLEDRECIITVPVVLGEITVTVPDGVEVVDETTNIMSEVKIRGLSPAPAGAPRIVLRGMLLMGGITVTGPYHKGLAERLGIGA